MEAAWASMQCRQRSSAEGSKKGWRLAFESVLGAGLHKVLQGHFVPQAFGGARQQRIQPHMMR